MFNNYSDIKPSNLRGFRTEKRKETMMSGFKRKKIMVIKIENVERTGLQRFLPVWSGAQGRFFNITCLRDTRITQVHSDNIHCSLVAFLTL